MRNPLSTLVLADGITVLHLAVGEEENSTHRLSGTLTPAGVWLQRGLRRFFFFMTRVKHTGFKSFHASFVIINICDGYANPSFNRG